MLRIGGPQCHAMTQAPPPLTWAIAITSSQPPRFQTCLCQPILHTITVPSIFTKGKHDWATPCLKTSELPTAHKVKSKRLSPKPSDPWDLSLNLNLFQPCLLLFPAHIRLLPHSLPTGCKHSLPSDGEAFFPTPSAHKSAINHFLSSSLHNSPLLRSSPDSPADMPFVGPPLHQLYLVNMSSYRLVFTEYTLKGSG